MPFVHALAWVGSTARPSKACSPGPQGLGARAPEGRAKACKTKNNIFSNSPGHRLLKGWESAETAAAEVGAWRETDTGYPPVPKVGGRGFSLFVTETNP